jgi:hypothetical protein
MVAQADFDGFRLCIKRIRSGFQWEYNQLWHIAIAKCKH